VPPLTEATRILSAIEQGDPQAAARLWPLVYDELRQRAAQWLTGGAPRPTPQAAPLAEA
jgi:ECF sigma factor